MEDQEQLVVKKPHWLKRFWLWIVSLFTDQTVYEITVWYVYETSEHTDGIKVQKRSQRTYQAKKIFKRSNKEIIGKDLDNKRFEIKTVEPFDYEIRKLK